MRADPGITPPPSRAALERRPASTPPLLPATRVVPPLLPVLLPLVVAAILIAALFAWLLPSSRPVGAAPVARFTDVTAESGLTFRQQAGAAGSALAPTTLSGGVVCLDFDRDCAEDLFFVNGAPWPWEESFAKRATANWPALFRNDGTGHFEDVTVSAGLNVELQGMTAAAGDFDDDGFPDLYVTCVGISHLFRNRGNGTFEDVTESAGVGGEENNWSTGAAWIDFDGDGRLDLVVCNYARWPREVGLQLAFRVAALGHSYGAPTGFLPAAPSVYRNLGDGRFELVPDSGGLRVTDPQTGLPRAWALAVVPVDANGDGRLDLLFSFQTSDEVLFLDHGGGEFRPWRNPFENRREGLAAGLLSASPLPFTLGAVAGERFRALQSCADLRLGGERGGTALLPKLGVALLDYDLDGRLDLFGGGRIESSVNRFEPDVDFATRPELLWNRGAGWIPAPLPPPETFHPRALMARGIATADFDRDGDLDIVISQHGAAPVLLRNDQRASPPWLQIDLVATRGHRDAAGARVAVHTPRRVLVQTMAPVMSFMAQSASTLVFGLGDDARVRKIVVRWPSGTRQEIRPAGISRRIEITEP